MTTTETHTHEELPQPILSGEDEYQLGLKYEKGEEDDCDMREAMKHFQRAASLNNTKAMVRLGKAYQYGDVVIINYEKAIAFFRQAASMGNSDGMVELANCLQQGIGVKVNKQEAVRLYIEAAEKRNVTSMTKLGECYCEGNGVKQDMEKGLLWLRRATNHGDPRAMFLLGSFTECENDNNTSDEEIFKLFEKAACNGILEAISKVGYSYLIGKGVAEDKEHGFEWFS